jgi:hypothetical protein
MSVDRLSNARAEDILGQVRRQLRREVLLPMHHRAVRLYSGSPRVCNNGGTQPGQANISGELAERLQELYSSLDDGFAASAAEIGGMPAPAPTLRGGIGRFAIRILQRLMWWYTRSLKHFAQSLGIHLQSSTETIEELACMVQMNRIEIAALREEIRLLGENKPGRPEIPR